MTIDMRERDIMNCCQMIIDRHPSKESVQLVSAALPIGDIIISDEETNKDLVIIERKTLTDLSASIKDGRYSEQSYRLNGLNHPNHNIVYLIEGDLTRSSIFKSKFDTPTLYSAMFSIQYFKGFSVMRSNTLEESAIILCNMLFKLLKSDKPPYYTSAETNTNTNMETTNDYCSVVKRVKKDNIQKDNIGEIMLCQIPGVSDVTSRAIFAKFKTITGLILAIQQDEHCLDDIQTVMANGKPRKINKTSVQRIVEFLKD